MGETEEGKGNRLGENCQGSGGPEEDPQTTTLQATEVAKSHSSLLCQDSIFDHKTALEIWAQGNVQKGISFYPKLTLLHQQIVQQRCMFFQEMDSLGIKYY